MPINGLGLRVPFSTSHFQFVPKPRALTRQVSNVMLKIEHALAMPECIATRRKQTTYERGRDRILYELEQPRNERSLLATNAQDTQSFRVVELEGGILRRELPPELPNTKSALAHVGVVKKNDRPSGERTLPRLKIVLDGLVAMQAVDM